MIKDKEFWSRFWQSAVIFSLFVFLGMGIGWLIVGFIEAVIMCFSWVHIVCLGASFLLISIGAFFSACKEYRNQKREEYEKRLLSLTAKRDKQRAIFFDENSSEEDKDFAWANVEMYEKEISRIATLYHKYGG